MTRRTLLALLALLPAIVFQPAMPAAGPVTVFAAASLKTAMDDIAGLFAAATGHAMTVSLAGSSALARQIQQGAPADIFVSANTAWMDALEADGLIDTASRVDLLGNRLVLIAPGADAPPITLADLPTRLGPGRLAMPLVDAVPAGLYGKAALETLGLWDRVAPRVAQADNVRAALALVAAGEAPFGIVYATDAAAETRVSVVAMFAAETHPPVIYPAAAIAGRHTPPVAAALAFLRGPEARAAFERQGFTVLAE